jgi:hypothetical protein
MGAQFLTTNLIHSMNQSDECNDSTEQQNLNDVAPIVIEYIDFIINHIGGIIINELDYTDEVNENDNLQFDIEDVNSDCSSVYDPNEDPKNN